MSVLEKLYYGNINPNEHFSENTPEYSKLVKTAFDNETKLNQRLDDEGNKLLNQLLDAVSEMHSIELCQYFIEAWKLSAQLMLETFSEKC